MNIFYLDRCPVDAAVYHCDKHVVKMCSELCQQLVSASLANGKVLDDMPSTKAGNPMKGGYHRHPCTVWVGTSLPNYLWAAHHGIALCNEYHYRYRKRHWCHTPIEQLLSWADDLAFPQSDATPPAQAMPDDFHMPDPVDAYRAYYSYKTSIMDVSYKRNREQPWWLQREAA